MKGAIAYYGDWGHCRQIAEMIIKGLLEQQHEVALLESRTMLPPDMEFIVIGAPTHLGKLPSPVRRFIKREIDEAWKGRPFAAYSTGDYKMVARGESQAADIIYKALLDKGLIPAAEAFKAGVTSMKGPLSDGALGDAHRFGIEMGKELNADSGSRVSFR
jgi:menaquinone-dependent protoporphyrinogen IX oxidase